MVALPTLGDDERVIDSDGPRVRLLIFDTEMWKPVPGYEGLYDVSSMGRVRSLPRRGGNNRIYGGKILSDKPGHGGYVHVNLVVSGKQNTFRVHELVMLAFHGQRPTGTDCIRHLDGNPQYNTPWNLVYGTDTENMLDTVRHSRHIGAAKTTCKNGHELVQGNNQRYCPACKKDNDATSYVRRKNARTTVAA